MTTDSEVFLTGSGENLVISTETVPIERIRLEKFIVTEERTVTVTVRREQVRLIREPLADQFPIDGKPNSEPEALAVMTLWEEQPTITLGLVPIERVWLDRRTVTGEQDIDDSLRREQIDVSTAE